MLLPATRQSCPVILNHKPILNLYWQQECPERHPLLLLKCPEGVSNADLVSATDQLNLVVVADTDLLNRQILGANKPTSLVRQFLHRFANNGDFVTNSVENLGGSNALISIRSRGTFARPFSMVEELTISAEQKFREQEQILQQQLDETEAQLAQLQGQQSDGGMLVLNEEQQQAVDDFMQKKIEIRKELRDVRHQLDKDIEELGNWLKFINIAIAPIVLTLILMMLGSFVPHPFKRQ